ncbi:MAG: hypothetical protein FJW40_05735 [Acidobacteria bacterium]|nr:hypothetical protein [Acidobacteriota bacterium]
MSALRTAATALLLLAAPALAEPPRIIYSKSFPGSTPAFVLIELARDGSVVYKEAPDDDAPARFRLEQAEADEIFAAAEKAGKFARTLESGLKVANMGMKTLRWEEGAEKNEQKFNYTQDLDARAVHEWFERMTETEQLFFGLERTVQFDKLGVNHSLLLLEAAWDKRRLVAVDQFKPLLTRVVKNESYLHMARERAAKILDLFAQPPPQPPKAQAQP